MPIGGFQFENILDQNIYLLEIIMTNNLLTDTNFETIETRKANLVIFVTFN